MSVSSPLWWFDEILERLVNWVGNVSAAKKVFQRSYLDVESYAELEGIKDHQKAERQLETAVAHGDFEKKFIYQDEQCPTPIVISVEDLGKSVRIADYWPDAEPKIRQEKIKFREHRARPIYVTRKH